MNISGALAALAPQPTGHPASLPAEPAVRAQSQSVASASDSTNTRGSGARNSGPDGEQTAAPPSAIQIKITEMLRQQAEDLTQYPTAPSDGGEL